MWDEQEGVQSASMNHLGKICQQGLYHWQIQIEGDICWLVYCNSS